LLVLILQYGYDLWTGKAKTRSPKGSDIWLFLFLAWLVLRTITTPIGEEIKGQPSTVMHLINGYLTPTFLFLLIRHSEIRPGTLWPAVIIILTFGVYLSLTAVLEITKQWSLVFPSFIGDPTLGIHFGRARGPMLQSVRLGMCLNFCLVVLWVFPIWLYARQRWAWLLAACLTPLFMLAILLTYTRSIWMGAGAIVVILLTTLLKGKARTLGLGSLVFSVAIGGVLVGPNLVAFKREYGEAETLESTRMRGAFAYVSMEMFKDRPLAGFGFNQFQVHNRPYLDDRTTNIRLESIRGYVHHNSYLSLLVDLGLIGALLFTIASLGLTRNAWVIWTHPLSSGIAKSSAVLCFCMVSVHAIQMAFHEVSFSSIEYTILMICLGLSQVFRDDLVETMDRSRESSEEAKWKSESRKLVKA
jgi:O-antigen ligase